MAESVLKDVQSKLKAVQEAVQPLPQGYQYKVRELCSCIEILVEMYDDIQRGIIPEVLKEMRDKANQSTTLQLPESKDTSTSKTISLGNIEL